ncbi:hypothetical protein DFH09DRAFT_932133 [Mycena vulgaris]|nr:hypothetical protein DFH09DRAFT_932133 [Mycena vulgaris]
MVSAHKVASKANLTEAEPFVTGGSWKKSPAPQTWIPPNGFVFFFIRLPICASLSKRSPSSIDTVEQSGCNAY